MIKVISLKSGLYKIRHSNSLSSEEISKIKENVNFKNGIEIRYVTPCRECYGYGSQECIECDGEGIVREDVDFDEVDEEECSYCYGSGSEECLGCDGSGVIDVPLSY